MKLKEFLELLGINATDEQLMVIQSLLDNPSKHLFCSVRSTPFLFSSTGPNGKKKYHFSRGLPEGGLIAFELGEQVYIGWCRRHPVHETINFTRNGARALATLRALTDSIEFISETTAVTESGDHIPKFIAEQLPDFINRTGKYFAGKAIANVIYEEEDEGHHEEIDLVIACGNAVQQAAAGFEDPDAVPA